MNADAGSISSEIISVHPRSFAAGTIFVLFEVAAATARDYSRRGSMILAFCIGCLVMLALRFTAIYGLGEELNLLLEFGLANLTIGGALLAILCAVPVRRTATILAADRALLTRAILPATLLLGRWLGACAIIGAVFLVWSIFFAIALVWFAEAEPTLFTMARDTTTEKELSGIILPVVLIYMQTMLLAGFATGAASRGSMLATALVVVMLLILGILIPDQACSPDAGMPLKILAIIIPDLRPSSATELLYHDGGVSATAALGLVLQAIGYGALGALAGSFSVRRK